MYSHVPPPAIAQIVQLSKMAGKRRLHVLWDYRYTDLDVVSAILWSALDCQPITGDHKSMEPPVSELAVTCGGCESKLPPGLMRCTRCMAGFDYGQECICEVLNQAKQLFVMAEKEDTQYAGKEAAARAKSTSRRSHGVYAACGASLVTRQIGASSERTASTWGCGMKRKSRFCCRRERPDSTRSARWPLSPPRLRCLSPP